MLKSLIKNETAVITTRFPSNVVIAGSPTWRLMTWNDLELLTGTASLNGSGVWSASVTVPKNLIIPNGEAELTVEFIATDTTGKGHIRSKVLSVIDVADDFQDYGIMYRAGDTSVDTMVFYDIQPTTITTTLREGYGDSPIVIATNTISPGTNGYDVLTSKGYGYNVTVPIAADRIKDQSGGVWPYQYVIEATFAGGRPKAYDIQPVEVMTPQIVMYVNSAMRLLDKARLTEIDQTLQWHEEEMAHFVLEGVSYLNGMGDVTYWTSSKWPSSLLSHLKHATAFIALNARYMAEGLNSFEFQGSNTQFSFNRQQVIQTKMEEMRSLIDQQFLTAKSAAIRAYGKGNAPPGITPVGTQNLGNLGLAFGPNTNRTYYYTGYRPGSTWRY